jgi:AcrR family transcriptional regulator
LRTKIGRPRQDGEARDTAETLKKSLLDLLSRSGYRNVTIKDISRQAGVTTAMIYYHFRDKNELLRATIEYAVETALKRFHHVSESIDHPAAVIHEWLHMHVDLQPEIGKVLNLIHEYRRSEVRTDRIDEAIDLFYDTERTIITGSVLRGREMGIFSDNGDEPVALSNLISTFLDGAVLRKGIFVDYEIRSSVELFEQMLWRKLEFSGKFG